MEAPAPEFCLGGRGFSAARYPVFTSYRDPGRPDRRRCGDVQQMTTAGRRHRIASDTTAAALCGALVKLGIGAGDEVIVPSFGPGAPADAVRLAGAVPVFADID